jgi:hypothetical protein
MAGDNGQLISIDDHAVVIANGDCLPAGSREDLIVCAKTSLLAAAPRILALTVSWRGIQAVE